MKHFQDLKIGSPCNSTSSRDIAAENRTDRWIIAAAILASFFAWLATGWLQYPTLSEPLIRSDMRTATAPSMPTATICMLADTGTPAGRHADRHLSGTPLGVNADVWTGT